ncbi:MAG: polyprenyl synthetase family protein [Alphaproteobacteria bacterium]|nr:polyprenyl synthetase family protein [Alphaproteobacteria bacterium]
MPSPREASSPELLSALSEAASGIKTTIETMLPLTDAPENKLVEAMRYATLEGGKRMRPFLVIECAKLFSVDVMRAKRVGAALEFVHCYSLVHDDLPAMDDADLRRGIPSLHKKYDEATAILAGDALLTLAFEVIADAETHHDPYVRCELTSLLAKASGMGGMVGGQMLDLLGETQSFDIGQISRLHRMKTGMLMSFACEAGAVLGKADDSRRKALRNYAFDLGLAFQVTDDILDVEGDPAKTGKEKGKDAAAGKSTFVTTLGAEQARMRAEMLVHQAIRHLHVFDSRADVLRAFAMYVLERRA